MLKSTRCGETCCKNICYCSIYDIVVIEEQKYSFKLFVSKVSTGLESGILRVREEFSMLFLFLIYTVNVLHLEQILKLNLLSIMFVNDPKVEYIKDWVACKIKVLGYFKGAVFFEVNTC